MKQPRLAHHLAAQSRRLGQRKEEGQDLVRAYTKLERGNATGISEPVIDGIARALRLDDAERRHLLDLIRVAGTTRAPRRAASQRVRPTVQRVLDSMINNPAMVLNARRDIVTTNQLGLALFSPVYADPIRPANTARFVFLDPQATEFFRDGDDVASNTVALPRAEAGRNPTTDASPTCLPAATRSAADGLRMTSESTAAAPSSCTTRSSAISTCRTSRSRCRTTSARACSPTPPNQARRPPTRSRCWPAGPPTAPSPP